MNLLSMDDYILIAIGNSFFHAFQNNFLQFLHFLKFNAHLIYLPFFCGRRIEIRQFCFYVFLFQYICIYTEEKFPKEMYSRF